MKVHIVWCESPYGVDFISVWDDAAAAEREADSLNRRDFDARYYVTVHDVNQEVH